jgi:hypothetical protein
MHLYVFVWVCVDIVLFVVGVFLLVVFFCLPPHVLKLRSCVGIMCERQ